MRGKWSTRQREAMYKLPYRDRVMIAYEYYIGKRTLIIAEKWGISVEYVYKTAKSFNISRK